MLLLKVEQLLLKLPKPLKKEEEKAIIKVLTEVKKTTEILADQRKKEPSVSNYFLILLTISSAMAKHEVAAGEGAFSTWMLPSFS